MFETQIFIILISAAAGILISGLLYFRQTDFTGWLRRLLFALRAAGIALLVYVLLAPLFHIKQRELLKPVVAVLVDNSSSILMNADSAQIKNTLTGALKNELNSLDQAEVQIFSFDEELHAESLNFTGSSTNIGQAIRDVKSKVDEQRLSAIVLASDGINNLGINPLYETENSFIPIYTLGVGDSALQQDLAISQVRAPEFIFLGDELVATITMLAKNLNTHKTEVRLKAGGKVMSKKAISVAGNDFARSVDFTIKPGKPGIFRYDVEVPLAENEKNTANNTSTFYVEVIENRKKITILTSAPDPDVAALGESLNQIDAYDVQLQNDAQSSTLREGTELVIAFFGPNTFARNYNKLLNSYNGPLWLFVSPQANQPQLNRFMPWLNRQSDGAVQTIRPRLSDGFGLFNLSQNTKTFLASKHDLHIYNGTGNEAGSFDDLLVAGVNNMGIVRYGQVENQRVVLFFFSGLWNMRMNDYLWNGTHEHIDEWLQLSAQYLTAAGSGNRLKLAYEKRISSNQQQDVFIDVYDAAFQQTTSAEVNLKLMKESGETFEYSPIIQGQRFSVNLGALQPGEYRLQATAKLGNEVIGAQGAFVSISQVLEAQNTQANYTLLQQMAASSGGKFHPLEELNELAKDLKSATTIKPIERITDKTVELIDLLWLLFVAVGFLAGEWVLRRYFGTI